MAIEVDQSHKIERTSKDTVLASSSGCRRTIVIPGSVKRRAMADLRLRKASEKLAYLKIFGAGVFILLRPCLKEIVETGESIFIDTEYPGHEDKVKGILLRCIREAGLNMPAEQVYFQRIGKGSDAHFAALQVSRGRVAPDHIVRFEELMELV